MKTILELKRDLRFKLSIVCRASIVLLTFAAVIGMGPTASAILPPVGPDEQNPDERHILPDGSGGWEIYPTGLPDELTNPDGTLMRNPIPGAPNPVVSLGYVWDETLQDWICPAGKHVDEVGYCVAD